VKQCNKCQEWKALDQFWRRAKSKDGRDLQCRDCRNAWYAANAEVHKARVYARNRRYRLQLYALLGEYLFEHPCVDCGETDIRCLEFDHRPEEVKFQEVSRMLGMSMSWERIMAEIEKCDVRCANCHRRRTGEHRGFWREEVHQRRQAQSQDRTASRLAALLGNLP